MSVNKEDLQQSAEHIRLEIEIKLKFKLADKYTFRKRQDYTSLLDNVYSADGQGPITISEDNEPLKVRKNAKKKIATHR